jgi:hypothetical protein
LIGENQIKVPRKHHSNCGSDSSGDDERKHDRTTRGIAFPWLVKRKKEKKE